MSLEEIRKQIDQVDTELVALLNQRAELSLKVGKIKSGNAKARYFAPERERDVMKRIAELHAGGAMPKDGLVAVFREIMSASIALQKPITVACYGDRGSYTEIAARKRFGSSANYKNYQYIADVFGDVERDQADYGVAPVENSTAGVIANTLDMFHDTTLKICAEVSMKIEHNLASLAPNLESIKRLYSFDQPIGQCRRWIDQNLPDVEIVETKPTTRGAERAAADPEGAAIISKDAAAIYNLPMLKERIEDNPHNCTRFLVVGHNEPPPTGHDKTSALFAVKNEPGSLGRALRSFETHNVNLSMIASRPSRNAAWEYVQFVDFNGHELDLPVSRALEDLRSHVIYLTVLGSYPEG